MTTAHQRIKGARKLVLALAIGVLIGVIAHAQTYTASFTPSTDTNALPQEKYALQYQPINSSDTNRWFWIGESAGTNIDFTAPASNPVLLSVISVAGTNESVPSEPYLFDTNNFTKARQMSLFPPGFLKVKRK